MAAKRETGKSSDVAVHRISRVHFARIDTVKVAVLFGRRSSPLMSSIYGFVSSLLIILVIVAVVVIALILVTYRHDRLLNEIAIRRDEVRGFRKERYRLAMGVASLPGISEQTKSGMSSMLREYASIKSEDAEIAWENRWIPRMRSLTAVASKTAGGKEAVRDFEDNEALLAHSRDALSEADAQVRAMEGNAAVRIALRTFSALSSIVGRTPEMAESASSKAGAVRDAVSSVLGYGKDNSISPESIKRGPVVRRKDDGNDGGPSEAKPTQRFGDRLYTAGGKKVADAPIPRDGTQGAPAGTSAPTPSRPDRQEHDAQGKSQARREGRYDWATHSYVEEGTPASADARPEPASGSTHPAPGARRTKKTVGWK